MTSANPQTSGPWTVNNHDDGTVGIAAIVPGITMSEWADNSGQTLELVTGPVPGMESESCGITGFMDYPTPYTLYLTVAAGTPTDYIAAIADACS